MKKINKPILLGSLLLMALSSVLLLAQSARKSQIDKSGKPAPKAKTSRQARATRASLARSRRQTPIFEQVKQADANQPSDWIDVADPTKSEWGEWINLPGAPFGALERELRRWEAKGADEPDEAMRYFLQKRLPEGERELPVEKYFEAQEQMRQMPQY